MLAPSCVSELQVWKKGCIYGDKCHFRHVEGKPSKKSKKGGAKGSVAQLKESVQLGCVSQDPYPRKSILRESGKIGNRNTPSNSPKGTWHQIIIRERRCPSRGIIQKCAPQHHTRKPCTKKGASAKQHRIWRNIFTGSRIRTMLRSVLLLKLRQCWRLFQKDQRSGNS